VALSENEAKLILAARSGDIVIRSGIWPVMPS